MLICLHYCRKDQHLVLALADWLTELGPFPNHDFLIFKDHRVAPFPCSLAAKSVKEIVITDDVTNSWPASANNAFKKIAKHVQYAMGAQPFFYIEPDAVILRASAFDEIEAEYRQALAEKKYFLGDLIDHRKQLPGSVLHMSGVGCYPGNMTQYAGEVFYADDKTPWDIAAGPAIHAQAKQSELLLHVWNQNGQGLAPFKNWQDVEQKIFARRPKCAIFHSDKTGSLLALLRERKNFSGGFPVPVSAEGRSEEGGLARLEPTLNESHPTPPAENNFPLLGKHISTRLRDEGESVIVEPTSQPERSADEEWLCEECCDGPRKCTCSCHKPPKPWTDKSESITEIQSLAARLRQFQTDMSKTRMVREFLHDAGVIKLSFRFSKRKGWRRKRK